MPNADASPPESHGAERLRDRLRMLSAEQLVESLEELLSKLDTRERLAFISRLPAVPPELLARELPYDSDDDFLLAIAEFCERVRNREFIEGEGYDREEREYRGYGDDSWIEDMNALFEDAEAYFIAEHLETTEAAYRALFDCLRLQENGETYFTTSDPQKALSVDLTAARRRYFDTLGTLHEGKALALKILEGVRRYTFIGEPLDGLAALFPDGGPIIDHLEEALVEDPQRDRNAHSSLSRGPFAPLLRQIYASFRDLEALDRFARQHAEQHPWCYEAPPTVYAERAEWQQVRDWSGRALASAAKIAAEQRGMFAEHLARASEALGDANASLAARWEALETEPTTARYVALRQAAQSQGQWPEVLSRLLQFLSPGGGAEARVHPSDARHLLVEALLVEGEYERAMQYVPLQQRMSPWDEDSKTLSLFIAFFVRSVTRELDQQRYLARFPEIARRLSAPPEVIRLLRGELFQAELPEAERDRQIGWIISAIEPRIDQIVREKMAGSYTTAAHDAVLISELHDLQGDRDRGQRFLATLRARYPRHRNFLVALKELAPSG